MTEPFKDSYLVGFMTELVTELTTRYSLSHEQAVTMVHDYVTKAHQEYQTLGAPLGDDERGLYLWLIERSSHPSGGAP